MDTADTVGTTTQGGRRPSRRRAAAFVGAGLVGGVILAGYASANAQTPTPSPSDGSTQAPDTAPGPGGPGGHGGPGGGHGGPGGMGIHGEFVTAAPGGGYQTIATQRGEVTAVSATSVTVKSEDGYSRTYTVDDNTLVNAGNDGIADVTKGDDVRVTALVANGKAGAVSVDDGTNVRRLTDRWQPRPPAPSADASGSTSGTAAT
jgi:hypothetical protein